MDAALYKELLVQRGLTYRYYQSPSTHGKPTLVFLHGFPSTAADWQKQVAYFQPLGYGILAPDLLGAGGTAKPLDPKSFRLNDMARDVMDILAAEGIDKVIGIGHDWGSVMLARLALLYPDTFHAYAWMGLAFMAPYTTEFDLDATMTQIKAAFGYEGCAYWQFFLKDDAHRVIQQHVDSFLQLVYPNDPDAWLTHIVLLGKTAECVEGDLQLGRPSYIDDQMYAALRDNILTNGVQSSLKWYNAQAEGVDLEDNRKFTEDDLKLRAPSFNVLPLKDAVCPPQIVKSTMPKYASDIEFLEVASGHWPHLQCAEEVNVALHRWLEARGW
ncbi:alpha/beta-hydrolase [Trametes versicolor FP-101664 SS1]|uniref:alpha/beta-hydrolase n=1 Tax=Trametes versicolor (strain FP-101664) TaxID=717944 RepID=UPI0004623CDA|nr:alpha/beta-hydrolase [Trametes versicolor FP-101664 SS1]EIW57936.1 alpha/beta-hydrolase [Trametes versicolor FP-101664 SS1]